MKKISMFLCVLSAVFVADVSCALSNRITVLHFNDFHGKFEPVKTDHGEKGGAARLAARVKAIEMENSAKGVSTFLFYGGDMLTGSIISRAFMGEAEVKFLNQIHTDAAVVGNHEFDLGVSNLKKRMSEALFPFLAANVLWKDGTRFAEGVAFFKAGNGPTIGIIGLTSKYTTRTTKPGEVKDLKFEDPVKVAKRLWPRLEKESDVQIALTHEGVDADMALARALPGLDAVIGGHDHVAGKDYCRTIKRTSVCQTPPHAEYLGRVDLEVSGRRVKVIKTDLVPIDDSIKPDPEVESLVNGYSKSVDKKYGVVKIAVADKKIQHSRSAESPLGDLVADAIRSKMKTDVALINSGGIRRAIEKGPITMKDLFEIFPFDNELVVLEMSGPLLQKTLDFSAGRQGRGGFLQVSGLTSKISDNHAVDIQIGGKPIDTNRNYTVAMVDFLAEGGDGYSFLKTIPAKSSGLLIRDAMAEAFKKEKALSPDKHMQGRIVQTKAP